MTFVDFEDVRVLIVDDDVALLDALSETLGLRFASITVDTCDTASAALRKISTQDYDGIISDIKMPRMDGLALLRKVQETACEIPVLLITGHGQTDLAISALRGGAFDLIQKPLDRDYIIAALRRAIETRRLRRQLRDQQEELAKHADEMEQRVAERTRELESALRAKDEFLGLVSHEFRTPVTVILGNAEVLHTRGNRLNPTETASIVLDLRQESRRLKRIIENLLVLGRLESGAKPAWEPVLLVRTIEREVERYRQILRSRAIQIQVPETSSAVDCNETQVELVVSNLLSNADKYSPPNQPIDVIVEDSGDELVVTVLDRGFGIKAEEAAALFEPFYRSESLSYIQGIGIGLTVCRRLVESHSGRIWAEPRPDGGSVFGFSLPIRTELKDIGAKRDSAAPAKAL